MPTFIKFLGWDTNRLLLKDKFEQVIEHSHCQYGVCFSNPATPQKFKSDDEMFLARLVKSPNDYAIFGKVSIIDFEEQRDTATSADKANIPWKKQWPYMLRVSNPMFIKGRLENCILMSRLIDRYGGNVFLNSQQRLGAGEINVNPRLSLMQKSEIELTEEASVWLNQEFQRKLDWLGKISENYLNSFPRPEIQI